jgi:hypothetical protein
VDVILIFLSERQVQMLKEPSNKFVGMYNKSNAENTLLEQRILKVSFYLYCWMDHARSVSKYISKYVVGTVVPLWIAGFLKVRIERKTCDLSGFHCNHVGSENVRNLLMENLDTTHENSYI